MPKERYIIVRGDSEPSNNKTIIGEYDTNKPNVLKSVGSIHTVLQFNDLMSRSLEIIDPDIHFSPDFPEFLLPKETTAQYESGDGPAPGSVHPKSKAITRGVVRQEPGSVSGTPFRGTQEINPREREALILFGDQHKRFVVGDNKSYVDKEKERSGIVKIHGQYFDNLVQYNIWSLSNREVETLTEWFREYMLEYKGMFREAGIVQMHYDRRVRDDTLVQKATAYHVRSVLYYLRTEEIHLEYTPTIKQINLNLYENGLAHAENTSMNKYLEDRDFYDRILNKWVK